MFGVWCSVCLIVCAFVRPSICLWFVCACLFVDSLLLVVFVFVCCLPVVDCWLLAGWLVSWLVVGPLVVGCWLAVVGCWLLVVV